MNWTKLELVLSEDHDKWQESKDSINALAEGMKSRKCKSGIWFRTRVNYGVATYELLIPGLKENHKLILRDLKYDTFNVSMSKFERRKHFTKLSKHALY